MLLAENASCGGEILHLLERNFLGGDTAVRERPESAVGIQKDLLGSEVGQSSFDPGDERVDVFRFPVARVHRSESDLNAVQTVADDGDITGSRCRVLENELLHVHVLQAGKHALVVPGKVDTVLSAPVAATHVNADANSIDTVGDSIDQLSSVLQLFARVTAGSR